PDAKRTTARHTQDLTFEELDRAVCRLLADSGRFALILPTAEFDKYLAITRLHIVRRCDMHPTTGAAVKRVMAEFARSKNEEFAIENITIEKAQRGDYTDEYRALTKDFYLKF
ncbi:MAG: methyltransferase, partial [Alistipes sp.]|nr:methyltransferase [Alistipes sp.]